LQQFGVKKVEAPSKNPKKCTIICFAPDKKIISRTIKIRGTSVREERESKSESESESESESKSKSGKGKGKEREN
jgi:hypothetical protein